MIHRGYSKYLRYLLLWNDIIILNIINIVIGYSIDKSFIFFNNPLWLKYLIAYNLIWILISFINPPFNILSDRQLKTGPILRSILLNVFIHGSIIFVYTLYIQHATLNFFILTYLTFSTIAVISRSVVLVGLRWYRKKGYNYRNIILIEATSTEVLLEHYFDNHPNLGYRIKKIFDLGFLSTFKEDPHMFKKIVLENEIDEVFINSINIESTVLNDLVNFLEDQFIKVRIVSHLGLQLNRKLKSNHYGEFWFLDISPIPMDDLRNRVTKRLFDIIFSLTIIVLFILWIYPIVSLIILIESGTPVLFKQLRTGEKNDKFYCLKFRTMNVNADADNIQSTKGDSRITKFGKFLRKSSIDELPQFFNVLKGEMSVVGPRPHMLKHTRDYSKIVDRYFQRHHVKPGITGLAQIKGYRGEINNHQDIKVRVNLDKYYIENWTLYSDLIIIFKTIFQMVIPIKKNSKFDYKY